MSDNSLLLTGMAQTFQDADFPNADAIAAALNLDMSAAKVMKTQRCPSALSARQGQSERSFHLRRFANPLPRRRCDLRTEPANSTLQIWSGLRGSLQRQRIVRRPGGFGAGPVFADARRRDAKGIRLK